MKAVRSPAPYRLCWHCNAALYGGGRFYRIVYWGDRACYVHIDCARLMQLDPHDPYRGAVT